MLGFPSKTTPEYTHNCAACAYLGSVMLEKEHWTDFYVCPRNILGRTYVARFSAEDSDFTSMPASVLADMKNLSTDPITVLLWLLWTNDRATRQRNRKGESDHDE